MMGEWTKIGIAFVVLVVVVAGTVMFLRRSPQEIVEPERTGVFTVAYASMGSFMGPLMRSEVADVVILTGYTGLTESMLQGCEGSSYICDPLEGGLLLLRKRGSTACSSFDVRGDELFCGTCDGGFSMRSGEGVLKVGSLEKKGVLVGKPGCQVEYDVGLEFKSFSNETGCPSVVSFGFVECDKV